VKDLPGNVKVVVKKNLRRCFVADKPWQAIQAAGKLKVTWDARYRAADSKAKSTTTFGIRSRRETPLP
jgi:hypothetical protein